MPKKPGIYRKEHPELTKPSDTVPPASLMAEMEADVARFAPIPPSEMIWTGGSRPIDINEELSNDIDDVTALDRILLAIIGSHCAHQFPPLPDTPEAKKVRHRLEQAKKHLLGRDAKRGTPNTVERELVWEIARRFWTNYAEGAAVEEEATLTSIAKDVVLPNWQCQDLDPKGVEGAIRPFINAFKKDRNRLLLRISGAGLPEIEERGPLTDRVIKLLVELGIVSAPISAAD